MIYFDSGSIYNRSIQKLQQDPNWHAISNNSVISALLKSNSEIQAETARYAEYLFQESKWDSAMNPSSILSMSNMLGYQPKRKISARGTIYISADPRTHNVGSTISSYYFESLNNSNEAWTTLDRNYSILSSCSITDSKGNSYIAIPKVFQAHTKVDTLDIIQGKRGSVIIDINTIRNVSTTSKFDPYLYIPVTIQNCEDASNATSRAFFNVYIIYQNNTIQQYRVVDTLLLSGSEDHDVEVYNDLYSQELFYLKFNNDPNRGYTLDISRNSSIQSIRIDYIESAGEAGNVLNLFEKFIIGDIPGSDGLISGVKLYGINFDPIYGGKDEETVSDIKINAPKNYINSYTAGTKEAYETAIANMDIVINNKVERPSKVQVYGSTQEDGNGNLLPITCISFIADGLEDIVSGAVINDEDPYTEIEKSLNYYLYKLKSPQDTLVFMPPNYVAFTLGLDCRIAKESTDDIVQLEDDIRSYIDNQWGSNSDEIDFERDFHPSQIIKEVMNNYPAITSISTEVEAVKKLDWLSAERKSPKPNSDDSSTIIHTIRIPFSFDNIFLGDQTTKGFKDYRVGADYVMRLDFMYKKPKQMTDATSYHTTIFIQDGRTQRSLPENSDEITDAFYYMKDSSESGIWPDTFSTLDSTGTDTGQNADGITISSDYEYLADVSRLQNSQQYYYKAKVYNDNDYRDLIDESSQEYETTLGSYLQNPGAIDDYLIYFSASYEDDGENIADGWIELSFDPIYRMLQSFAAYDSELNSQLSQCPLSLLKCGNTDMAETFSSYLSILNKYVDIYLSLRPVDANLIIDTESKQGGSTVLYIDTQDGTSIAGTSNLTSYKQLRMTSVSCKFED